jgi:hypothetical protein
MKEPTAKKTAEKEEILQSTTVEIPAMKEILIRGLLNPVSIIEWIEQKI